MRTSRLLVALPVAGLLLAGCGSGGSGAAKDCNGVAGGGATLDHCGVCDADPTNDCVQDCAATWGGTAARDNCGTCDTDPSNDCVLPDNIASWDGSTYISSFGVTDSATYGQVFKVWNSASPMTSFSFEVGYCNEAVSFRGSVYAWDGSKATGSSLYTSALTSVPADSLYHRVTFDTGSLSLPAGDYVIFASTSADQAGAPASACRFGAMGNNTTYPDGQFYYLNNGTNTAVWTSTSWSTITQDLAFQVTGLSSVALDCNGVAGGRAVLDNCGVCDDNPTNDCVQDCAATWGGTAARDACGTCDTDPSNDCVLPDNIASWDGSTYISSFGVTNTATYGQVFKVWNGASPMTGFSVEIGYCGADVSFRGSVFAWDGTKATGSSLYTSPRVTVANQAAFQRVYFDTGSLNLPAGNYVLFVSTAADQPGATSSACRLGSLSNNTTYPDGQFVFLNNGANPAAWTSASWSTIAQDLAFQVTGLSGVAVDCNGVAGGRAVLDNCGVCDANPANDCVQDCAGTVGGTATLDACGTCDSNPSNDCVLPDNIASWNGSSYISSFGVVDSATYGQVIKVWQGATPMTGFSFEVGNCSAAVSFRGSVYAWDGSKATGSSLFTSALTSVPADSQYHLVTINTGVLPLLAGNYVIFASTSADQAGAPTSACRFGALTSNTTYPDGQFYFLNNGTNTAAWTSTSWSTLTRDLAFQVTGLVP
jgi:hypothetical protein